VEENIIIERRIIMLTEQTLDKLYSMKLDGMADAFKNQINQSGLDDLSFEERFSLLVDNLWTWKEDRRMGRLLANAKLKLDACIEDIDFKSPRGIDKTVILSLSSCNWIKDAQNIIITGPTGVGKSYLACALANRACRIGYTSYYIRAPRLFHDIAVSRADGTYGKFLNKLAGTRLLLIDDLGLAPMTDSERRDLLEVIEDRYGLASTIVSSQLPIKNWHEIIGDPTIADAILDRLVHNAHKIQLKGDSMRKKKRKLD
jgi:DNA replication protein DnaC